MNQELLIQFVILNVLNVIIQTTKSIATIRCGKLGAASMNALAFGLYTVVLVYMNCELELWMKVIIVAATNFIGVYFVKTMEAKLQKAKLWKIELCVKNPKAKILGESLRNMEIPYLPMESSDGVHTLFYCYASTFKESELVKEVAERFEAKYHASESKNL